MVLEPGMLGQLLYHWLIIQSNQKKRMGPQISHTLRVQVSAEVRSAETRGERRPSQAHQHSLLELWTEVPGFGVFPKQTQTEGFKCKKFDWEVVFSRRKQRVGNRERKGKPASKGYMIKASYHCLLPDLNSSGELPGSWWRKCPS